MPVNPLGRPTAGRRLRARRALGGAERRQLCEQGGERRGEVFAEVLGEVLDDDLRSAGRERRGRVPPSPPARCADVPLRADPSTDFYDPLNPRKMDFTYDVNGDLQKVTSPAVTGTPNGNDFPSGKTTE